MGEMADTMIENMVFGLLIVDIELSINRGASFEVIFLQHAVFAIHAVKRHLVAAVVTLLCDKDNQRRPAITTLQRKLAITTLGKYGCQGYTGKRKSAEQNSNFPERVDD